MTTPSRNVHKDLAAARAARNVIRANNNGSRDSDPAYWELLRAANRRILDLEHEARPAHRRGQFTVTVTLDTGARWVDTFDTASGAAAEVFERLAAVDGAAFSITTAAV